jgi:hypothetical protein
MSGAPRVHELLSEARRALVLRRRLSEGGADPAEIDEALDGLYRDLGQALVSAVEAAEIALITPGPFSAPAPEPPAEPLVPSIGDDLPPEPTPIPDPDPVIDEADDGWYSDEPSGERPEPRYPLFDPEDLALPIGPDGHDPLLDDSTPVIAPEREFTAEEPADYVVITADEATPALRALCSNPTAPWRTRLDELLGLLTLPASFADVGELTIEASRVQWATSDLPARIAGLPPEVQIGLIAMIAARAQHLRARLDVDVGPRLSLDRLQRFRLDADLPAVAGLRPMPRPEDGSWERDARRWWRLLGGADPAGGPG